MISMELRPMQDSDADAVREIDQAAFSEWWKQAKGPNAYLPLRTEQNILISREKDPEGCFVAEDGDRPVGFIFSRTWGTVGWFGPFGVLPEYQSSGVGRRLI